jgi:glycosyltransferase involved in cell wall biosynthesis
MKFSIITVCYNSESTIASTIQSVAAQTWRNYEHIIVDGASTDRTLSVVRNAEVAKLKVISEPDHGIYDAMNKGVAASTGDVICFLNADDVFANSMVLATVVELLQAVDIDIVTSDVSFFRSGAPDRIVRRYNSGHFTPNKLRWGWMPAHPGLFVKRRVFDEIGPFSTSYKIAGDFDWIVRVFALNQARYCYWADVSVNMQLGGVSTRGLQSVFTLNREIYQICRRHGIQTNYFRIYSKYPRKILEMLFT